MDYSIVNIKAAYKTVLYKLLYKTYLYIKLTNVLIVAKYRWSCLTTEDIDHFFKARFI